MTSRPSHNNDPNPNQGGGGCGDGNNESSGRKRRRRRKNTRPVPLAPPPSMSSRKRARRVTTLFHRYTRDLESAKARLALDRSSSSGGGGGDGGPSGAGTEAEVEAAMEAVRRAESNLEEIGGRDEYQRASRLNTSLHSTSRWVVGFLGKSGWLSGIPVDNDDVGEDDGGEGEGEGEVFASRGGERGGRSCDGEVEEEVGKGAPDDGEGVITAEPKNNRKRKRRRRRKQHRRRHVRLLEIGAVNSQLLDAATNPKHRLRVRAIDLHRSPTADGRIEELDFFDLPYLSPSPSPSSPAAAHDVSGHGYDVVVCSMVINSVPTPEDRGKMLVLLHHHLRPGGLCFLTVPMLCLTQSRYTTKKRFVEMLTSIGGDGGGGVGFELVSTRESPKIAFFVLRRSGPHRDCGAEECGNDEDKGVGGNIRDGCVVRSFDLKWTTLTTVNRGRKFRNDFSVVLPPDDGFAVSRKGVSSGGRSY